MSDDLILVDEAWRLAEASPEQTARVDRNARQSRRTRPVWWCCEDSNHVIADYGPADCHTGRARTTWAHRGLCQPHPAGHPLLARAVTHQQ
jgi:hypothetical protein